jgi:hypothetical protein
MALGEKLSYFWSKIQRSLFPFLDEELGELTEKEHKLATILELVRIEKYTEKMPSMNGRPKKERSGIARAFVAKSVYNMPTTRALLNRLESDKNLRRICGWENKSDIPSESTFSRAFAEFAKSQLPAYAHEAVVIENLGEEIINDVSRDSTEIEAREKPVVPNPVETATPDVVTKRKPGRPKKGEERVKEPTRLERQRTMTLEEMLIDLPRQCNKGTKKNSKGYLETWTGYKFHIDSAKGQIPISCILTSASTHDSQVALPLALMSSRRVINLYDLMDAAYDAPIIRDFSRSLGHVPIIDINTRRNTELKAELKEEARRMELLHFERPEDIRYKGRTNAERVNARIKDEFGGRLILVRGYAKVMTHLMFGILALTADQLVRMVA